MIAAWMIFGSLTAALIWISGEALQRAARAVRRPARFVWLFALVASVGVTATRLFPSPNRAPVTATSRSRAIEPLQPVASGADVSAHSGAPANSFRFLWIEAVPVPAWAAEGDRVLGALWIAGSVLWGLILAGSAMRLRRRRTRWLPAKMDGQPVFVSHDEGPALFGIVTYSIVVPSWVLELEPRQRSLVLAHEREHARAADPVVLLICAVLVMAQPWNLFAWLMFQRLRFAVEADCDARVLAGSPEVRAYGELLIDLGERTLAGAAPIAALSEPHTHLRKRVALMTRQQLRRPALQALGWVALSVVLIATACRMPRPVSATPGPTGVGSAPERVIVHITAVEGPAAPFRIEIFATGPARVGLGTDSLSPLRDTLRLDHLPAMRLDVTESDIHVRLVGPGRIGLGGEVTGGPAIRLSATGREIVLFKGGSGIGPVVDKADTSGQSGSSANAAPRLTMAAPVPSAAAQPAGGEQVVNDPDQIRRAPTYTPFARPPVLRNRADVANALPLFYPQAFDRNVRSGTPTIWLLVEADGTPSKVLVRTSSGYPEMDDAALKAARLMRFFPAANEELKAIMVWIAVPIAIEQRPLRAADSPVAQRDSVSRR